MTDQQMHETGFWAGLVQQRGADYAQSRWDEYPDKTRYCEPLWTAQEGMGIEVGCGCVSVLENRGKMFVSIDPLMDYYRTLIDLSPWRYRNGDAECIDYPDSCFDWVFCVNMIDHTPDPGKALDEMHRVLKPGGRLYFEVHFDDSLSPAHYGLWNADVVKDAVDSRFGSPLQSITVRLDEHNQSNYWAVYEK